MLIIKSNKENEVIPIVIIYSLNDITSKYKTNILVDSTKRQNTITTEMYYTTFFVFD